MDVFISLNEKQLMQIINKDSLISNCLLKGGNRKTY